MGNPELGPQNSGLGLSHEALAIRNKKFRDNLIFSAAAAAALKGRTEFYMGPLSSTEHAPLAPLRDEDGSSGLREQVEPVV